MQFIAVSLVALTATVTASADAIADPANPANLINCPPNGGAESCKLEVPCNRVQITYASPQGGHTIWYNNACDGV
ncbi:hypothetical protein AAF712_011750 [Marasmius tenuissimus]|uniref:Uncharacterized protein n=1 Tax=Marasmius tenuissimus TaxID=585030 RepID=A0ABR2ZIJ6_9AGAR